MISENRLSEWGELAAKATYGPWERGIGNDMHDVCQHFGPKVAHVYGGSDGNFIAASRDAVPALIAEVMRLQAENTEYKDQLKTAHYSLEHEGEEAVIECEFCCFPIAEGHADDCKLSDRSIPLDAAVGTINKEIEWCYQNPEHVSEQQKIWFINGLEQARNIIITMAQEMAK